MDTLATSAGRGNEVVAALAAGARLTKRHEDRAQQASACALAAATLAEVIDNRTLMALVPPGVVSTVTSIELGHFRCLLTLTSMAHRPGYSEARCSIHQRFVVRA
jgi:hypothetical protein